MAKTQCLGAPTCQEEVSITIISNPPEKKSMNTKDCFLKQLAIVLND